MTAVIYNKYIAYGAESSNKSMLNIESMFGIFSIVKAATP